MHIFRFSANVIIVLFSCLIFTDTPLAAADITFIDIPASKNFPKARDAGALRFACAGAPDELSSYFSSEGLRFNRDLLRTVNDRVCHIHYEPTLRGFRAHPDSTPVRGLFLDMEHVSLLSRRTMEFGDNLDMAKAILANLPRPMDITLSVPLKVERSWYDSAVDHNFPASAGHIWLRDRPVESHHTWAQDYMKSGQAGNETRTLMPRRAFEGQAEYGETFKDLLKTFSEKAWVRSKLAWDGGDLIFIHDPRDRSRLLLLYGDAARPYWGESLTDDEYGYVLATEFGADAALNFGGLAPHVDYFVSFLPDDDIALVAQPLTEDYEISRNTLELLTATFSNPVPPVLERLKAVYATRESALGQNAAVARALIAQARKESSSWATPVSAEVYQRLEAHIAKNCRGNPSACLAEGRLPRLLEKEPDLLRDWVEVTATLRMAEKLPNVLLSVLESQLPGAPVPGQLRLEEKIRELQQLGFRVVRVPRIGGGLDSHAAWAGISYVNAALIDETLFVPVFGLGAPEQKFLDLLQAQLPAQYRVAPVFARYSQLYNGGTHCILAFFRDPALNITTEAAPLSGTSPDRDLRPGASTPAMKFSGDIY